MSFNLLLLTQLFAAGGCNTKMFLGVLPTWYKYLPTTSMGEVSCHVNFEAKIAAHWGLIALAILEIMVRIGGMVALGYIIYGGIKYISSQGEPDRTREAQNTVMNAIIGLVIVILAVPLIGFIANKMG